MLRSLLSGALRTAAFTAGRQTTHATKRCFSSIVGFPIQVISKPTLSSNLNVNVTTKSLLQVADATSAITVTTTRSVTKFSLIKGKRKSVKAVVKRFKRLDWGAWIRTHSGRHKKLFKKSSALKRRLRQHIFTNAQQSWLLDKMVTNFWRRPKYYIDDPYTPYHRRDEYFATKGKTFKV